MEYLQLVAGFVLLFVGGESLVSGSVKFARGIGFPPILIGLTLVAFGTSAPELATSIDAALAGSPGIAVGNVVGSNITNVLLIIGLVAVISPIACSAEVVRRDGSIMLLASILCLMALRYGELTRWIGVTFVLALAAYLIFAVRTASRIETTEEAFANDAPSAGLVRHVKPLLIAVFGLTLVLIGADWLVDSSISIAQRLGVNESIVGLTIVAAGTSMPELVTSLIAAIRREADIAIGNIIGSNIFNILAILGATAVVAPISVPAQIRNFDGYMMCVVTLLFVAASITGRRVSRGEGLIFLAMYIGYIALASTHIKDI
ncbi:MAG: calcium/sodium antiporter [Gammaproteobacteria bacterium]|nr:calcium/sodium antiporter [Gammaproteobacteria bacterium]MDH4313674.1 calcium/sodium antiporter [Gammaproteobacteria bacterium]MDH5214609.1 calcium/sodium antiporter [Gammaproteobacteria bacterium]MDH5500510.1 calcium/sodium antiporter [Gammaproteobacteria bacterium]